MTRAVLCAVALLAAPAVAGSAVEAPGRIYHCQDGGIVEARYIGADHALVRFMGRAMMMEAGPAADGVRYVGGGWQWWTRGMDEGLIAPVRPGAGMAAEPGRRCAVSARATN
ncbi:MliC family protein [Sphingomonas flavalba]|uniref:MliC family protein n=1 Tax=Sphingomonas flavalba TaxID=2559804 RepID=UPI0039E0922F